MLSKILMSAIFSVDWRVAKMVLRRFWKLQVGDFYFSSKHIRLNDNWKYNFQLCTIFIFVAGSQSSTLSSSQSQKHHGEISQSQVESL